MLLSNEHQLTSIYLYLVKAGFGALEKPFLYNYTEGVSNSFEVLKC